MSGKEQRAGLREAIESRLAHLKANQEKWRDINERLSRGESVTIETSNATANFHGDEVSFLEKVLDALASPSPANEQAGQANRGDIPVEQRTRTCWGPGSEVHLTCPYDPMKASLSVTMEAPAPKRESLTGAGQNYQSPRDRAKAFMDLIDTYESHEDCVKWLEANFADAERIARQAPALPPRDEEPKRK
jgi:hypothetical protein